MNGAGAADRTKRGADPAPMTPQRRRTKHTTKPESGHRSERRLRDAVKNAAIGALATDDADRERLGEMFEIVGEYEGRSPFSAACDAYHRGDDEAVAMALGDDRRLDALAGARQ